MVYSSGIFLFVFLPVTTCGLFLGFLFPLFAEAQGCSINEISLAFMIFGVGSVYLGPTITRLTSHFFGSRRSVPLGALVMEQQVAKAVTDRLVATSTALMPAVQVDDVLQAYQSNEGIQLNKEL